MIEISSDDEQILPRIKSVAEGRREAFGTPENPSEWVEITENNNGLKNYLTFERRMQMLVRASLGEEKQVAGSFKSFKEWVSVKNNPDRYFISLGEEFKASGIQEKSIMDMGAGAGAIIGLFEKTGVFPKKLVLTEPKLQYYDYINDRVDRLCKAPEGQVSTHELIGSKVIEGEEGHKIFKLRNRTTGQEFDIETLNRYAGKDKIQLAGDDKVDSITFSGVAKYYEPEDFKKITDELRPILSENGNIAFSFSLDDAPGLDAKVHKMLKKDEAKHPYTQRDIESLFSKRCVQSYGDNYVCTLENSS